LRCNIPGIAREIGGGSSVLYHFIQILPINERTITASETPRKHPGQIHNPSNRTLMVSVVAFRRHVGRRERRMLLLDLFRDMCPVCRRATTLSVIEPHLTRTGLDIYTFNCDLCGHATFKVVETLQVARAQSIRSRVPLPTLTARVA
jgi:hypothetical protein